MKCIKSLIIFFSALLIIGCSMVLSGITVNMPDLTTISDGIYRGTHDLSPVPVKVTLDVTVVNHKVNKIDIIDHSCSAIGKKAEKITDQIIKKQSLDIDVVTGATASSEAILMAVKNALQ